MHKEIEDSSVDSQVETLSPGRVSLERAQEPINKRWMEAIRGAPEKIFYDLDKAREILYPDLVRGVSGLESYFQELTQVLLDVLQFGKIIGEQGEVKITVSPEILKGFVAPDFKGERGINITSEYEFIVGRFNGKHQYFIDIYPQSGLVRTGHSLVLQIGTNGLEVWASVENGCLRDYGVFKGVGWSRRIVCRPRKPLDYPLEEFPLKRILNCINSNDVGLDG